MNVDISFLVRSNGHAQNKENGARGGRSVKVVTKLFAEFKNDMIKKFVPGVWCSEPQAPAQGFVMGTGRQFGDRVRYACSPGYRLVGADDSTCLAHGIWSALPPQCEGNVSVTS